jgi:hypothetical protein
MIIKEYEGEVWCISKHLLASSMRLMEVGTKAQSRGKREEAYDFFEKAYDLYSLFWGLQMNVIGADTLKKEADLSTEIKEIPQEIEFVRAEDISETQRPNRTGFMGKL